MSNNKPSSKIISLLMTVALAFGVFAGMPLSVSAESAPIGLSAPTNPHWEVNSNDEYTGNAVWDNVPESGTEGHVLYHWILYGPDGAVGRDIGGGGRNATFKHNLSSYFEADGDYQFKVQAIGDGLNYTDSEFSELSDIFHYTKPEAKLPTPTGLAWKQVEEVYYATWENLFTSDYNDEDSFTVRLYNESGSQIITNIDYRTGIIEHNMPGIPLDDFPTPGRYYFTVQANSSRPNKFQSSNVATLEPDKWLTITAPIDPPVVNPGGNNGGGSSGGSSGGSGGGSSGGNTTPTIPSKPSAPKTKTPDDIKDAAAKAKSNGEDTAKSKGTGEVTIKGSAWKELSGLGFQHDTVADGKVQVRVTINDPASLTQDLKVSAYVTGKAVENINKTFDKYFSNATAVVHFDQTGSWGQEVRIAAKFDLTGMNKDNLVFYSYDKATNKYQQIQNTKYYIDENGYTHFTTSVAGDIIVSNGPLVKK